MNINAFSVLQMVVFFLGAWITMKYIWPPLIHAIEERQKKIADGLSAANKGEKLWLSRPSRARPSKPTPAPVPPPLFLTVKSVLRVSSMKPKLRLRSKPTASSRMLVLKLLRKCSVLVKRFVTKWLLLPLPVLSRSWPVRSTRPFTPPCLNN